MFMFIFFGTIRTGSTASASASDNAHPHPDQQQQFLTDFAVSSKFGFFAHTFKDKHIAYSRIYIFVYIIARSRHRPILFANGEFS